MNPADHLAVAPFLLPLLAAAGLVVVESSRPALARLLGVVATIAFGVASAFLAAEVAARGTIVYQLGNWPAPFGIVLVVDALAALMLVLTAIAGLAAALALASSAVVRAPMTPAILQVQLAGLAGAFTTGDLFNLFVCFEVLLIASYGLLAAGDRDRAVKPALRYVVLNLVGSSIFLVAAATLYGVAGTLNFADLARKLPVLDAEGRRLAHAGCAALMLVFLLKAAIIPAGFWIGRTYAVLPPGVAAIFAVMTKVGVYGVLRVFALGLDGAATGASLAPLAYALGIATAAAAAFAALAAKDLHGLAASLVAVSSGVLVASIASGPEAWTGAIVYLAHSTVAAALLFVLAGALAERRGALRDRLVAGPPAPDRTALGLVFFAVAVALAGLPPFAGFGAKVLILGATPPAGPGVALWVAMLGSGWLALLALGRAGSTLFWASGPRHAPDPPVAADRGMDAALALLAVTLAAGVVLAQPVARVAASAASALADRSAYARAVLEHAPVPARPEARP